MWETYTTGISFKNNSFSELQCAGVTDPDYRVLLERREEMLPD